jgi:MtN3 and saliva related transmembrane protein
MNLVTVVGVLASIGTTASYFPQLVKCWQTGKADDLSLRMFLVLTAGVTLWVLYGILKSDWVIIAANSVSLCLLCAILFLKLRGLRPN